MRQGLILTASDLERTCHWAHSSYEVYWSIDIKRCLERQDECSPLVGQIILSQLDLGSTLGTLNIGVSLSAIAYGITCCQAFYYYRSSKYKQDSWCLKTLVGSLMFLVTFQQALISETCYYYLVSHYDDPCALLKIAWPAMGSILLECIVGIFVKCFLTHRVWMLSHNKYVTALCIVVVIAQSGMSLFIVVKGFMNPSVFGALYDLQHESIASFGIATTADMTIGMSIVIYLYRSRTGIRRTDDLISKLMILTVSTGLVTSVVMLIGLILCAVYPVAFYSVTIEFILGKLYMTSLLTTLNMRDTLLARRFESATLLINTIPLANIGDNHKARTATPVNVKIDRAVERDGGQTKRVSLDAVEHEYPIGKPDALTKTDEQEVEDMC